MRARAITRACGRVEGGKGARESAKETGIYVHTEYSKTINENVALGVYSAHTYVRLYTGGRTDTTRTYIPTSVRDKAGENGRQNP